jgi:hypothetical protein
LFLRYLVLLWAVVPEIKWMMMMMMMIAKGGYYRQLGRSEGLSESTTMGYLHDVSAFFQHTAAR